MELEELRAALMAERDAARAEADRLCAALGAAHSALRWCGGSNDFTDSGIARAGWNEIVMPVLADPDGAHAYAQREADHAVVEAARWVVKSFGEPDADEDSFTADLRAALAARDRIGS